MNQRFLGTAWHEVDANLVFGSNGECVDHGLEPFYAAEAIIREHDGSTRSRCVVDNYTFSLKLYFQDSGIGDLGHPSADLETIREFRIKWEVVDQDDDVGERSGTIHIAPRTPNMKDHDGNSISTPGDLVGVNCRVQGSNLPLEYYDELLHQASIALGFDARYFHPDRIHAEYSNIQDAARYVRIVRGESGRIHSTEGVLARISRLLATDREGYRKHVADDTEEPGYYHSATIGPKRVAELVPQHRLPKEIKHYLPRTPDAFDPENPLFHPKLEVSLQSSRGDGSVKWHERGRLARELDETLLNVLNWDGFPVTEADLEDDTRDGGPAPGGLGPYVEDQYFVPETRNRQRRLVEDPTPEIETTQDNIVTRFLVDGLEDSDMDVLELLVADGGQVAPKDVAENTGWHLDTVYRAIDRLEELVEHKYDELALRSHHVARRVSEAVKLARQHSEDALTTMAKAIEADTGLTIANDALLAWMDRLGVEVEDRRDAQLELRLGRVDSGDDIRTELQRGLAAWRKAGWDPERFRNAQVQFTQDGYTQYATVGGLI